MKLYFQTKKVERFFCVQDCIYTIPVGKQQSSTTSDPLYIDINTHFIHLFVCLIHFEYVAIHLAGGKVLCSIGSHLKQAVYANTQMYVLRFG